MGRAPVTPVVRQPLHYFTNRRLSSMKTYIHLSGAHHYPLPANFRNDDVRYPESLVEYFIEEFTQKGDIVFDPFAGFGTTLVVAERMERVSYGMEIDQDRVNFARSRIANPKRLIHGDARHLGGLDFPQFDFSMTSPPYMTRDNHPQYPFSGYRITGETYGDYLRDIRNIYAQLRARMKPSGKVVLEVANLKSEKHVTTLAWDVAQEISQVFRFEGEVIVCWDQCAYGNDHTYCLLFSVQ